MLPCNGKGFMGRLRIVLSVPLLMIIVFLFLLVSCEDNPSQVGLELKNALGQIQPVQVDTISVFSSVETMDSVRSDHSGYSLLGNFQDPVFGWSEASFITQYRLSNPWIPGNNADVDSVKLFLQVNSYTGNEVSEQTVNVYELFQNFYFDSIYYSNLNVKDSISEWPVGSATFHPKDSMIVVSLSKSFGRKIIQDTAVLKDQYLFLSHFKGFYINVNKVSGSGDGGFIRINLLSSESYMALYYHNDLNDQLMFPFYINTYSVRVNLFDHNYEEAPPETRIRYLNQGIEDSVMYVQGMSGVYTHLFIPGFKSFRDSSIILNSVRLIIPVSPDDTLTSTLKNPEKLILKVKESDGRFYDIIDYQYPEFYGGTLDTETGEYSIGLTKHVQNYLTGNTDVNDFYLTIENSNYDAHRAVLNACLHSNPLKVEVIYTRF